MPPCCAALNDVVRLPDGRVQGAVEDVPKMLAFLHRFQTKTPTAAQYPGLPPPPVALRTIAGQA